MPVGRRRPTGLCRAAALAPAIILFACPAVQAATSPFGVGLPEQATGGLLPWIGQMQTDFYKALTGALKNMSADTAAFWWLAGLSFLYGAVHAAGPGHGKVVLSSYMLASGQTVRRGILLAFAAAMVQASVAVALVSVVALALNATAVTMTGTARIFEIGSYGLITAIGIFLLARKLPAFFSAFTARVPAGDRLPAAADTGHIGDASCGHTHHVDPTAAAMTGLRGAASAVIAVGMRPCTGALIVLVFAVAQGHFWAGVASAYLMGIGTALTIALLAVLAVSARDVATRLAAGRPGRTALLVGGIEVAGALAIAAFGLLLLGGSLFA